MRIDAHQHFWIFNSDRDSWITDDMAAIQRNFLPTDLAPSLKENGVDGVIAVQASQSIEETKFLADLSTMYAMVKGVVGWVDLQAADIEQQLQHLSQHRVIKGFRHVIEGEDDPDFLMRPAFLRGIEALTKFHYTYDLLIRPRHYASTLSCVEQHPNQRFVLDHMAKPNIKTGEFTAWAAFMEKLSAFPNVYCKVSGLVTEANWNQWMLADFKPYIQHAIRCFGSKRLMFGTDWPVCLLAGSYADVMRVAADNITGFTAAERDAFWGGNAAEFYNL
ncbi:amidohydrolase family protein [Sphingobacterium griseoflavum]|uniref:Amidohydrolase n=1 Tax=Sphingobacterium griseoflavum TaxID=1474952 RepID=A0ABQ3HX28_9SPHI|nr:amidohydrolase family protein [Sphingobacterium griseoflavum]GHE31520.1 amidohydrolase [Sphingobacterium griseoflavum]